MGFVGLCFHNVSASTAVQHISLKKFQKKIFQKYNKSACFVKSIHWHLIDFYDEGKGRPFLFSFLGLQTSCSFETIPKAAHRVAIGANWQIVIAKPRSEPTMTNSFGVAEDFSPERGQPPGFHVGPIQACERFHLWELNYRFWDLV